MNENVHSLHIKPEAKYLTTTKGVPLMGSPFPYQLKITRKLKSGMSQFTCLWELSERKRRLGALPVTVLYFG
jgi:hypothetical protein